MGGRDANELKKRGVRLDAKAARPMGEAEAPKSAGKPWPELLPLAEKAPPFPIDALPAELGAFVSALAKSIHVAADLPAAMALASVSTATAGRLRVRVREGWSEPALLYVVGVAPPSARKSPVFRAVMRPVFDFEREKREAEKGDLAALASAASINAKALAAAEKKAAKGDADAGKEAAELARKIAANPVPHAFALSTGSPTPEAVAKLLERQGGRIAVLSHEAHGLAKLLVGTKDGGGVNLGPLLEGYDGDGYRAERVQAESRNVERAFVTLGLLAQPHVIKSLAAARGVQEMGFTSRLCFAVPDEVPGAARFDAPAVPENVTNTYSNTLRSLLEWGHKQRGAAEEVLFCDAEATARLAAFFAKVEQERQPGGAFRGHDGLNEWAGKLVGRMARIAGLLHAWQRIAVGAYPGEGQINGSTMSAAERIGDWLTRHAMRAFDVMEADATEADGQAVWEWVQAKRPDGFDARDFQRNGSPKRLRKDSAAREAAFAWLMAKGHIRKAGSGRFEVSPHASLSPHLSPLPGATPNDLESLNNSKLSPLSPLFEGGADEKIGGAA